eukprot:scaffold33764_cov55-Phaeocystis_antarctica.AAC.1
MPCARRSEPPPLSRPPPLHPLTIPLTTPLRCCATAMGTTTRSGWPTCAVMSASSPGTTRTMATRTMAVLTMSASSPGA